MQGGIQSIMSEDKDGINYTNYRFSRDLEYISPMTMLEGLVGHLMKEHVIIVQVGASTIRVVSRAKKEKE